MKKRSMIFIILGIILAILIGLGITYHFRDRRTYELDLPQLEELTRIKLEQSAEGVNITDVNDMKEILDILYGVKRITENQSIQDSPVNVEDEIKLDFYLDESKSLTVFVYKKNNKYYIEQPYNGIYRISPDEYNSIEKYVR